MDPVTAYISGPAPLPSEAELRETSDKYPWFSAARVLLYREGGAMDDRVRLALATGRYSQLLEPYTGTKSGVAEPDSSKQGAAIAGTDKSATAASETKVRETGIIESGTIILNTPGHYEAEDKCQKTGSPADVSETGHATLDIIDRFLATDPQKITPDENVSSDDKALDSATDDDEMVTEELAAIYLAQGASQRAREIYLKLSLLYPEKSVYFAEIIARIDAGKSE